MHNHCIYITISRKVQTSRLEREKVSQHDNNFPLQEFQNYTVARDTFLAHLGATLWDSMRHIILPSIADGAFHFYDKISFQLFFITQEV